MIQLLIKSEMAINHIILVGRVALIEGATEGAREKD